MNALAIKSAEAGNTAAQFSLGVCYENGTGVDKNVQKADLVVKSYVSQYFFQHPLF